MCIMCKPATTCSSGMVSLRCTWCSALVATTLYLLNSINLVGPYSALRRDQPREVYALFFDAGSTGTRLHVFTFYNVTGGQLELKKGHYFHTQPGLSSFLHNPENARSSISGLLKEAQKIVPVERWHGTPVALKATAGLRLLPKQTATQILDEVRGALTDADLSVEDEGVSILDGKDEGLFAWYTVNFLLGRINDPANSVAVLDLGGGSTQVSFQPDDFNTIVLSPKNHIVTENIQGKPATLYVHSYLGLGLMSARMAILYSTSNLTGGNSVFSTPCFHPNASRSWSINGQEYFVRGMNSTNFGYDACYHQAKAFLAGKVFSPKELKNRKIYTISYYFDRAADAGLIDRQLGGTIMLEDLLKAAKEVCSRYSENKLFLCLDLTYITTFLHNGMGFDLNKKLKLVKRIASIDASWALGAAFSHLS